MDDDFLNKLKQGQALLQDITSLDYQHQPRKLVCTYQENKLYHYSPDKVTHHCPLLIVFATVNRPDILDIYPDYSFIKRLLSAGQEIYLLEWNHSDSNVSMENYICDYLDTAVNFILSEHQRTRLNMLGVCQGGVYSLCYAALFNKIDKLILLTTPINFHTEDHIIAHIARGLDINLIDRLATGQWLSNFFISLRPFELIGKKYLTFLDHLSDPIYVNRFLLVEKWLKDAPDQSVPAFKQFIKDFYQQNKLIKNEVYLGHHQINLSQIKADILNVIAEQDDIVPPSTSKALKQYIPSSQYSEKSFPAGHIGIYLNQAVSQHLSVEITEWLTGKY